MTEMVSQQAIDRGIRIRRAQEGARSTEETRVLLIAHERGLTAKQLAKFWTQRRKNGRAWFDYEAFAEAQDISLDWLFEGDIRAHPRGTAPRPPVAPPHGWGCGIGHGPGRASPHRGISPFRGHVSARRRAPAHYFHRKEGPKAAYGD